jgi:hypothetical protein
MDAVFPLNRLCIISLFRNNESYLPFFLQCCNEWEKTKQVSYYFIENDSTDATPALLKEFIHNKRGKVVSGSLHDSFQVRNIGDGRNYERIIPLANLRNYIVDLAANESFGFPSFEKETCVLLVDSDIFFPVDVLSKIEGEWAEYAESKENVGMLTCYTQQIYDARRQQMMGLKVTDVNKIVHLSHYFDTYAFLDDNQRSHFPYCAFEKCRLCEAGRPATATYPRPLIPRDKRFVHVSSAFGGFALVPASVLMNPRVRWSSHSTGFEGKLMIAEHVVFCDRLLTATGKGIILLQNVDSLSRL